MNSKVLRLCVCSSDTPGVNLALAEFQDSSAFLAYSHRLDQTPRPAVVRRAVVRSRGCDELPQETKHAEEKHRDAEPTCASISVGICDSAETSHLPSLRLNFS